MNTITTYDQAVEWIAGNELDDIDDFADLTTVQLAARIYQVDVAQVARDVERARQELIDDYDEFYRQLDSEKDLVVNDCARCGELLDGDLAEVAIGIIHAGCIQDGEEIA